MRHLLKKRFCARCVGDRQVAFLRRARSKRGLATLHIRACVGTIGPRIGISRCADESTRCTAVDRLDQFSVSCPFTPSITLSTSSSHHISRTLRVLRRDDSRCRERLPAPEEPTFSTKLTGFVIGGIQMRLAKLIGRACRAGKSAPGRGRDRSHDLPGGHDAAPTDVCESDRPTARFRDARSARCRD
jgi:hypothetical protein